MIIQGNDECSDCGLVTPEWASYNLGIFLCTRCAAVHRFVAYRLSITRTPGTSGPLVVVFYAFNQRSRFHLQGLKKLRGPLAD